MSSTASTHTPATPGKDRTFHKPVAQRVIAVANHKGGVGKTTTVFNLAGALAERGAQVLVIDMDPQGALTRGFGGTLMESGGLAEALEKRGLDLTEVTSTTSVAGVWLVPASERLREVELGLSGTSAREVRLRNSLRKHPQTQYDFILLDCAPSLGFIMGNALVAANEVIIPVDLGTDSLTAMIETKEHLELIQEEINYSLRLLGILVNELRPNTTYAQQAQEFLQGKFGALVFETAINQAVIVPNSKLACQPVVQYRPSSPIAEQYRKLADEVIARGEAQHG